MTDFSDVSVGDRVRLTHERHGTAEFEVRLQEAHYLTNGVNAYFKADGWTVEILERAAEKLPTGHLAVVGKSGHTPYVLISGVWYDVRQGYSREVSKARVKREISLEGFEVLYEGIQ